MGPLGPTKADWGQTLLAVFGLKLGRTRADLGPNSRAEHGTAWAWFGASWV